MTGSIRWALLALVLGGCVAQPTIDPKGFSPPKSVVILDTPRLHPAATVGVTVPWAPGPNWFHFSERADYYFLAGSPQGPQRVDYAQGINEQAMQQVYNSPKPMPMGQMAGAAFAGAAVGAIIQSAADETFRKSQTFVAEIYKIYPEFDLRADFMNALVPALKSHGVEATLSLDSSGSAPRLRWPATEEGKDGKVVLSSAGADGFPAVDADLLVQLSPLAFFNAPGPLNAYRRNVSVGIALYNGRTKQFLGRQNVWFVSSDARFEYSTYDALVADLRGAAPALRQALLSLVPDVASIVAGKPVVRR
jgi:hypothetical protein